MASLTRHLLQGLFVAGAATASCPCSAGPAGEGTLLLQAAGQCRTPERVGYLPRRSISTGSLWLYPKLDVLEVEHTRGTWGPVRDEPCKPPLERLAISPIS